VAWDSSRPVPYRRLVKEWLIYAAIMAVIFVLVLRDSTNPFGLVVGLVVSLPLYIGLSYVLAKFGYQRKTLAELRTRRAAPGRVNDAGAPAVSPGRNRPAPDATDVGRAESSRSEPEAPLT
jgi:hypothetical protein